MGASAPVRPSFGLFGMGSASNIFGPISIQGTIRMRQILLVAAMTAALFAGPFASQAAQDDLTGKWNGKLDLPTTIIPLEFDFETDEGGTTKGTVRYPGTNIRQTALGDLTFSDGILSFSLGSTRDSYQGRLSDRQFVGELTIAGSAVPLTIRKGAYEDFILKLPGDVKNDLLGQWFDKVRSPTGGLIIAYRFETDKSNRLVGFADVPERQQLNMPITNATVDGENISFEVPTVKGRFVGEIKKGKIIGDALAADGQKVRLSLKKGQYTIPYALEVSKQGKDILQGRWEGQIERLGGSDRNIFRFAVLDGRFYGYVDNPSIGLWGMRIDSLSLKDGRLRLETASPPGRFTGEVSGGEIHGSWVPGGQNFSLSANYKKVTR